MKKFKNIKVKAKCKCKENNNKTLRKFLLIKISINTNNNKNILNKLKYQSKGYLLSFSATKKRLSLKNRLTM